MQKCLFRIIQSLETMCKKTFDYRKTFRVKQLLFTRHYPARCFGMNMPKSRDIQAKIPLPQAIWNEFWQRY